MSVSNLQRNPKNQLKQSNILGSNSRSEINNSQDQSQYEIVVEFELRRQRQKTRILQQRLHNKQIFIQQMKQYQDQLTLAFQKCQEELILAKKTLEQYHIVERDYIEEIAELKHLVIRLQDEINLREKNQNKRHCSQLKKQENNSPYQHRETRAKTVMHQDQQLANQKTNKLEMQLLKQSKKISKFIKQFLVMAACFSQQNQNDLLKNKLKSAWKWIKEVVKEWSQLKYEKQLSVNKQEKPMEKLTVTELSNKY